MIDLAFVIPAGVALALSSGYIVIERIFFQDDDDEEVDMTTGQPTGRRIKKDKKRKRSKKYRNRV